MNQTNESAEDRIARISGRLFAESVSGLDGETRSRLARARAAAVEAAGSRGAATWLDPSRLVPLGGVAAGVLALALVWQGFSPAEVEPNVLGDLDMLLESESLDLFEELEFYAWLLEQSEELDLEDTGDDGGV